MTNENSLGFGTIPDPKHMDQGSTVMYQTPQGGYTSMQQAQVAPIQPTVTAQDWNAGDYISTPNRAPAFGGTDRAVMPGFTPPSAPSQYSPGQVNLAPQQAQGVLSSYTAPAPQAVTVPQSEGMLGIPSGAPMTPFGGSRTASQNPYLQGLPQVQTATGTPYDRVQMLQQQQQMQALRNYAMMQQAKRQDSSPLAMIRRGLAGFAGKPMPVSAQQQALGLMQALGAGSKDYNDAMLKAINDGQGSISDLLKGQHELAGDYNTAAQNDAATAQNARDFGLKQDQFNAAQKQQGFTNDMTQKNFGLAQGAQNLDQQKLQAQIAQQHDALGLEAQKAMQSGNIARANLAFQKQKMLQDYSLQLQQHGWNREDNQAQYVYNKDGIPVKDAQGNPVPKYNYNPAQPAAKPSETGSGGILDPLAKFLGYVPKSQAQQPQAQTRLPQPTKTNNVLDASSAQAYMNQYGSAAAARAAALADGWRTK